MKIFIIILFVLISFNKCELISQDGWFWLNPLPQGNWLTDVEFTANNTVYVSGYGGTMMKSTDGGVSFTVMANKECGKQITFINNLTGFSNSTNGILKTTNGGNNWRYIPAPVDSVLNFYPTPSVLLYGIKNNKVFLSSNLGESWNLSLTAYPNDIIYSAYFLNSNTGYAVGSKQDPYLKGRIYKTTNTGISWDTLPASITYGLKNINFFNANIGFALTTTQRNLIKTTNGGYNWETVFNLPYTPVTEVICFDQNNGYLKSSSDLHYTTNQGNNWIVYGLLDHLLFLKDINNGIGIGFSNNQSFLYRTTNTGVNWINISTGFTNYFYDVTFINNSTGFISGDNKIYKTINSGANWIEYPLGLTGWSFVENIMFPNQNTGFAGIDGGKLAKTTNGGMNWNILETGQLDHLHGMSFPSADTGFAVTKYGAYLKTVNGGNNWIILRYDSCSYGDIVFMDNLTGFNGGTNNILDKAVINKTSNGGLNWERYYLDSMYFIRDLCVSPNNSLFAAGYNFNNSLYNGVIYRTTDLGNTWLYTRFPNRISSIYFSSILTGYASTENNIMYKTTNAGLNWFATYCSNNFESYGLYFTNDLTGYAVSPYGQIIKTTTGGGVLISVQPQSYTVPQKYTLYQNYPNPFNPVTKLKFDIPVAMNASLKIYDIIGREISVIVSDFLIPGSYEFDFDGSSLSSGVYFYVLNSSEYYEAKKMVLIK